MFSCSFFESYNSEGYRDGSDSGTLMNEGSLVGTWEETYEWDNAGGEGRASWRPVNIRYSDRYVFLEDGTFTSTNTDDNCIGNKGTYTIEGSKLKLIYLCQTEPETTIEVSFGEFFFREKHIVFIKGNGDSNISKFELVKEG